MLILLHLRNGEVRALEDPRVEEDQARQGGQTQRGFGSLDRLQLKTWIVWAFVFFSSLISPMIVYIYILYIYIYIIYIYYIYMYEHFHL